MNSTKLILLEFNELTPKLMMKFIEGGHLPNFKKMYLNSLVYTTDANEKGENLNPWVQWVTVHTGLSLEKHKLARLNELENFNKEFIWDNLSQKGHNSFICGSMNASYRNNFKGLFLTDPWNTFIKPYPVETFHTYINFVSKKVQNRSSINSPSALHFFIFMVKNGLSLSTIKKILVQFSDELLNSNRKWKRAILLDWLQFDLFKHHYKKSEPKFATFFSNSTAHFQHHYWRDMQPTLFTNKIELEKDKEKKSAILLGYKSMDKLLGQVFEMTPSDTVIGFITALSQQPYTETDRHYYHIINKLIFYKSFNIKSDVKYKPVMAEQFHLECKTEKKASILKQYLEGFEMENNSYFHIGSNQLFLVTSSSNIVHVQCRCTKLIDRTALIFNKNINFKKLFYDVFNQMSELKSGCHHPLGMFWLFNTGNPPQVTKTPIPLTKTYKLISRILN